MMGGNKGGFFSTLKGFLFGGLVGAVLGLLLAPKSGKEIREDLKTKTDELIGQGREAYLAQKDRLQEVLEGGRQVAQTKTGELKAKMEEARESIKRRVGTAAEFAQKKVDEATDFAEEKIEDIEKKLTEDQG